MTLVRWSPSWTSPRDLVGIQDEVNRLFDSFFGRSLRHDGSLPFSTDVEEAADEFIVRADLPGVRQQDVKVTLTGDVLTICGERREDGERRTGNLHRNERVYGSFERSFALGAPVRSDKVTALYRDGVLEVRVPKAEEARVREVEVKVA